MCVACLLRVFLEAAINVVSGALTFALFIRVALSWIPGARLPVLGGAVYWSTNSLLAAVRRVVPPIDGTDFSPLAALLLIDAVTFLLLRVLPPII
ncbi:MAG: YggT family protein [Chloroflexi bacterium]|nr:MAG: YggT family protein [Chloroflexota bacterium]